VGNGAENIKIWLLPLNLKYTRGLDFYVFHEHLVMMKQERHNKWNRHIQILWHQQYFWQVIIQLQGNSFKAISHILWGKVI
jgi:hypothetical protein